VAKEMGIVGVFSAEGADWKRQRRVTVHALDANHLRQFFPTIKVTERLRNRWNSAADKQEAEENETFGSDPKNGFRGYLTRFCGSDIFPRKHSWPGISTLASREVFRPAD
jgi:hypothetical protein